MGIGHDGGLSVHVSADQISGLTANAGKLGKLFHRVGHLTVILVAQHFRHGHDALGLGFIQPAGADHLTYLVDRCFGKGVDVRITLKQGWRDQIHPRIGALGGQAGGDEKLKRIMRPQRTDRVGKLLFECLYTAQRSLLFGHMTTSFLQ